MAEEGQSRERGNQDIESYLREHGDWPPEDQPTLRNLPRQQWQFLRGSAEGILATATGFRKFYRKEGVPRHYGHGTLLGAICNLFLVPTSIYTLFNYDTSSQEALYVTGIHLASNIFSAGYEWWRHDRNIIKEAESEMERKLE